MHPITPTFDNTLKVLVTAWLNGTLLKGDCHACAIGNMCASALGYTVNIRPLDIPNRSPDQMRAMANWNVEQEAEWISIFATTPMDGQHRTFTLNEACERDAYLNPTEYYTGLAQLEATGYSLDQLADIELAFETAEEGYTEEAEFAGLMAVVDVLADIHKVDLTTAAAAKAMFVRA